MAGRNAIHHTGNSTSTEGKSDNSTGRQRVRCRNLSSSGLWTDDIARGRAGGHGHPQKITDVGRSGVLALDKSERCVDVVPGGQFRRRRCDALEEQGAVAIRHKRAAAPSLRKRTWRDIGCMTVAMRRRQEGEDEDDAHAATDLAVTASRETPPPPRPRVFLLQRKAGRRLSSKARIKSLSSRVQRKRGQGCSSFDIGVEEDIAVAVFPEKTKNGRVRHEQGSDIIPAGISKSSRGPGPPRRPPARPACGAPPWPSSADPPRADDLHARRRLRRAAPQEPEEWTSVDEGHLEP